MKLEFLCSILELPDEVVGVVKEYHNTHESVLNEILSDNNGEFGNRTIEQLQQKMGEDPHGFFVLSELLSYACRTYDRYMEMGIDEEIFIQTMKFCTRFVCEHRRIHGEYAFTWAWWFSRQLTMQEFRIGEFEFEFVNNGEERSISIHIPGDANMEESHMQASFRAYHDFLEKYYPDWLEADWYCESWLLSPALEQLLSEKSNILKFQHYFQIVSSDEESLAVLDWVYPGEKADFSALPEHTSLQKNMKKFLQNGGKVGWTKGRIKKNEI